MTICFWIFARVLQQLPESWVGPLTRQMGRLVWSLGLYRKAVVQQNIAQAYPELSPSEQDELGRQNLIHLFRTLFEFFRIPRSRREGWQSHVDVLGLEHVAQAQSIGRGVLALSAHLGNFEIAVAAGRPKIGSIAMIVKTFPNAIDRFVDQMRKDSELETLSNNIVTTALAKLRAGYTVVVVLDQNATRKKGVFTEFFGRPASTMPLLAVLARRSGAPVLPVFSHREKDGRHVVQFGAEIPWHEEGARDESFQVMTQRYTEVIESAVRKHPEQWIWSHKRWRTQPHAKGHAKVLTQSK